MAMTKEKTGIENPLHLISLSEEGVGHYSGCSIDGAIGRVFGGQALAQTVRAASYAIGDQRPVSSLHAYFVSPALSSIELQYSTNVIKSGRSLDIVSVTAEQGGRTLLAGLVSTHEPELSESFQLTMPSVPDAETLTNSSFIPPGTNPNVRAPFHLRYVTQKDVKREGPDSRRIDVWIRTRNAVPSDAAIDHTALLVYAVDFLVTRAAHAGLANDIAMSGASLDHAMWFHRPFRIDDWLLVSSDSLSFADARGLSSCHVFNRKGELVATATQEALIRPRVLKEQE
jgi:acyl-CoA thioesterase-2